ncbi:hypothetical protein C0995_005010 [Termitomyces sp. Mi166|nr:hypothetical protein C0995_005010 [Termitomyces sp. Mi166\
MSPLPAYLDQPKLNEMSFSDWSFSNASSSNIFDPFFQPQHPATRIEHDANPSAPLLLYDQPIFTYESVSPASTSPILPSEPSKVLQSHIPRPPNAFMLYRSDFLKRGIIPAHVERRQQNLSRIAGQCWNLLPLEEKAQWQQRAAQALLEHQKRNPDYKFTPAPRGSRRTKVKGSPDSDEDVVDVEDRIRQIREQYARIAGPTMPPARRRRPRGQNRRDLDAILVCTSPPLEITQAPLPPSIPTSPCSSISSPEIDTIREAPLPPFFPHHTIPQIIPPRRPSTSLGFAAECSVRDGASLRAGLTMARPSSAAPDTDLTMYIKDLDITPTVPTFDKNSSPASPGSPTNTDLFLPKYSSPQDEIVYPTLNPPFPATASVEILSVASSTDAESFLESLYSNNASTFNSSIVPAEEVFAPLVQDFYVSNYDPSSFQSSWSNFDAPFLGHMRAYTM